MTNLIDNDLSPIGMRSVINTAIVIVILAVCVALVWRYFKNTFSSFYTEAGECPADDFYYYKDAKIHPGCK